VINFGASTAGHRDYLDQEICAVYTFKRRCKGGEICLYEPGFVLESRDDDLVNFDSAHVTHFNTHFEGLQGSIVLHSDSAGKAWGMNYNEWPDHVN
jgi:hypothetical protein